MPKQLAQEQMTKVVSKAAIRAGVEEKAKADILLEQLAAAVVALTDLQRSTEALMRRPPPAPPAPDNSELFGMLERLIELQALMQSALAVMAQPTPERLPTPKTRVVEMTVTDRDAWGRIKNIKATLEE